MKRVGVATVIAINVAAAATVLATKAAAQDLDRILPKASAPCVGDLERRHQGDPPWDFTTNSRSPTPQEPTVYLHCIFNNDPKNWIEVNWLIPKVKQPIPGSTSALSPRYSDKPPFSRDDGCLIFGNLHNKALRAQFWARPEDRDALNDEKGKDCLTLRTASLRQENTKIEKLAGIAAPFRFFLQPSANTFVAFEGVVGARIKDPTKAYESFVTYRLRTKEQDIPSQELSGAFELRPRWTSPVESLAKAFSEQQKAPLSLAVSKEPITITFLVVGTGVWTLRELEYVVTRRDGAVVGSIFAPVYVPLL
jgi:hypothetical protein